MGYHRTGGAVVELWGGITPRGGGLVSRGGGLRCADDPEPLVATGRASGLITQEPVGYKGFGFDPVLLLPPFGQTFAQLPTEVKNANSHRGKAAQQMLELMRDRWFAQP